MKKLSFSKYEGTGNDFLLFDDRQETFPIKASAIQKYCDRRFGIGADGIILLQSSKLSDFRMRIFNSDGKEAESCGNGLRCVMRFLLDLGFAAKTYIVETKHHQVSIHPEGENIAVFMGPPKDFEKGKVLLKNEMIDFYLIDTGVPHAVVFIDDVESIDVNDWGREIRMNPSFQPHGVNVDFASWKEDYICVRTYERGVEGETLACGTGAAAVATIAAKIYQINSLITIRFPGGDIFMDLCFDGETVRQIKMIGPANFIFSGTIVIPYENNEIEGRYANRNS